MTGLNKDDFFSFCGYSVYTERFYTVVRLRASMISVALIYTYGRTVLNPATSYGYGTHNIHDSL